MKIKVIVAFLSTCLFFPILSIAGDVAIVVNPSNATSELSRKDIKNIYLGKKTTWDDGRKITFVVQKDSGVHRIFLDKYLNETPSKYNRYWKKLVFTGNGVSPKVFDNEPALIKFVSETGGAVGYISNVNKLLNVKKINVD